MTIKQEDMLRIITYLDGELEPEAMIAFEIRLTNEPDLAQGFESFEAMDQLERQLALVNARPTRLRFLAGGRRLGVLAAAGLLVLSAGLLWTKGPWGSQENLVAVLPSSGDWLRFNRQIGLGAEWVDLDPSVSRGSGDPDAAVRREYFEHVAPAQEERLRRALSEPGEMGAMEFFNLVLELDEARSVIVLMFDPRGQVLDAEGEPFEIAYPNAAVWSKETGRAEAGGVVVLPRRNVRWNEQDGSLDTFDQGFLVPIAVGKLEVLMGLRKEVFDDALRLSLDAALGELSQAPPEAEATRRSLTSWLEDAGFEVRVFEVEEK